MCIYIYTYIYPPPCLQAHRACLIQWHILQASEEEGVEELFFRGKQVHNISPRATFVCLFFEPFPGPPFSSQRDPKGLPNGAPKSLKVQTN